MNTNNFPSDENMIRGIVLPVPTSLHSLPNSLGFNLKQIKAGIATEKALTQQSGIHPGTYTTFSEVKPLIHVQEQLWDTLESKLCNLDRLEVCNKLYQKLEIIVGHMQQLKYQTASDLELSGRTEGAQKRVDAWGAISPITEGIKFLVEMAVKHCVFGGKSIADARLDFLVGISAGIVMLDQYLDFMYGQVIPFEVIIAPDFRISGAPSSQAIAVRKEWLSNVKTQAIESDRDFISSLRESMGPKIKNEDFAKFPELVALDKAMMVELGYGLFDWLDYCTGCMDFFRENEFLKVKGVRRLCKHIKDTVGLKPDKVELLLKDHSLSVENMQDLTRKDMMPMENYDRDFRLLRRPLLDINHGGARIAILGVETFNIGMLVFFNCLEHGMLRLPRMQQNGPIKSAIGRLQAQRGAPFRDSIASKCTKEGFQVETEWSLPRKDKIEKAVGPIDVLVIDHKNKRFILVEAKALGSPGHSPVKMKEQRDRFLEDRGQHNRSFLVVLKEKEEAFESNKEWHLHRLKLNGGEDYSVESVIVVNYPMFWPFVAPEPLPILDDLEFYKRLKEGQHFLTHLIKIV